MIEVTKPYLPNRSRFDDYVDRIYRSAWLTNNGPLVRELTARLESYLGVENLLLVSNGTLALQIAFRVLGVRQAAVTTPFSFVATTSSLALENIQPRFADIEHNTFCLNPSCVASSLTPGTTAIVPTHVFGVPCKVAEFEQLASSQGLKLIFDASHAFGITIDGRSVLRYGDASTLSFHATKVFHTIEGGAIVFRRREDLERAREMINFGIGGANEIRPAGPCPPPDGTHLNPGEPPSEEGLDFRTSRPGRNNKSAPVPTSEAPS